MKSFPSLFAKAKSNLTGEAPLWILKLTAGGTNYYLSDNTVPIPGWNGGITTKPWISFWGALKEGLLSGRLDEILQADMPISCVIDPDANPNIETLVTEYELEESPAVLYLWFRSLDAATDPPQAILSGYIEDISIPDETTVNLTLQDGTCRLEKYIGNKVTLDEFPEADEDDVGRVIPIPFGAVEKLPTRAVLSGAMTSLPNNLNDTDIAFAVSDTVGLSVGDLVQVDDEQILIGGISNDQLTVTRGYNGTVAEFHGKGSILWEIKARFDYLVSDVPVDAIPKVYGRVGDAELDITEVATVYTGQSGDEHADYPGRAVITMPSYITASQAVNLLINDGISVSDTLSLLDDLGLVDSTVLNNTLELLDSIDVSDGVTLLNSLSVDDLLAIVDTIAVNDGVSINDTISVSDNIAVSSGNHEHPGDTLIMSISPDDVVGQPGSWIIGPGPAHDGNTNLAGIMYGDTSYDYTYFSKIMPVSYGGKPLRYRWAIRHGDDNYSGGIEITPGGGFWGSTVKKTDYSSWYSLSSWSALAGVSLGIKGSGSGSFMVWEIWLEVEYSTDTSYSSANVSKTGSASKSGTVSRSGLISKDGTVSRSGLISLVGEIVRQGSVDKSGTVNLSGDVTSSGSVDLTGSVSMSGSVVKTGTVTLSGNSTANTLVGDTVLANVVRNVSVPEAFNELLSSCGFDSIRLIGTLPSGYALNGAITEYKRAIDWLYSWAFQLRCWFRLAPDSPRLIIRPDSLIPQKAIPAIRLKSDGRRVLGREKLARSSVVNSIQLLYVRDWNGSGESAYRAVASGKDQVSIDQYGEREEPDLFQFDFVTGQAMAESLCAFYLEFYAVRRWQYVFDVYLDHCEIEFGDDVRLDFLAGQIGTVIEAGFTPGSISECDTMTLSVIV